MASPVPLDAMPFETLAAQSAIHLDAIMNAATLAALTAAQARGVEFLRELVAQGEIGINDARRVRAIQDMAADERLRDLPAPGAVKPVGLFGGRA